MHVTDLNNGYLKITLVDDGGEQFTPLEAIAEAIALLDMAYSVLCQRYSIEGPNNR